MDRFSRIEVYDELGGLERRDFRLMTASGGGRLVPAASALLGWADHRAAMAFCALAFRWAGLRLAALAWPPLLAPSLDRATAAGFRASGQFNRLGRFAGRLTDDGPGELVGVSGALGTGHIPIIARVSVGLTDQKWKLDHHQRRRTIASSAPSGR